MRKNHLTLEQRIHNAIGSQTVQEYKARHAYLHGVFYSREEWDLMWYRSVNTTWAHQFGRMVGWDEVYLNSVEHMDRIAVTSNLEAMVNYPVFQGHDLRSVGCSGCHVLSSDVIEVADDGRSARASYLTPGTLMGSVGMSGEGRSGIWLWERYGSDFVYEDGRWQWFHEQVCPDIAGCYDAQDWARDRYLDYLDRDLHIGEVGGRPAQLSEPGLFHADYSIVQTVQNTVPPPKPYQTLDDDNTYSPGRNDPTGKQTVHAAPKAPANHTAYSEDENPFRNTRRRNDTAAGPEA